MKGRNLLQVENIPYELILCSKTISYKTIYKTTLIPDIASVEVVKSRSIITTKVYKVIDNI